MLLMIKFSMKQLINSAYFKCSIVPLEKLNQLELLGKSMCCEISAIISGGPLLFLAKLISTCVNFDNL